MDPQGRQCVWIGTITDERSPYGQPLIYVAHTEEALLDTMRAAYDVDSDGDAGTDGDWLQRVTDAGVTAKWDFYGVEGGAA